MATDFIMNLFTALGESAKVDAVTKNTRDNVLWNECLIPWRRSPLWLLIRVFLHLFLTRVGMPEKQTSSIYKAFMVMLLSRILRSARVTGAHLGHDVIYTTSAKLLRRLQKMQDSQHYEGLLGTWSDQARFDLLVGHAVLSGKQQEMVEQSTRNIDLTTLRELNPEDYQDMSLPQLDEYCTRLMSLEDDVQASGFDPSTSWYPTFAGNTLPSPIGIFTDKSNFRLTSIENWVCFLGIVEKPRSGAFSTPPSLTMTLLLDLN